MSSRRLRYSLAAGTVAAVVVGGGAIAAVGPERLHEKLFGENERESVSEFAREHHGINMHSQAVATVMEKLDGGEESLGPNQMRYDDNAFPHSAIASTQVTRSLRAFRAARPPMGQRPSGTWKLIPNSHGTVPGPVTYTGNPSHVSGRTTAIAVGAGGKRVFLGTAGGGVWKTSDITAAHPTWRPLDGLPTQAIGSLTLAHGVLYVGTGEPNGSSDSEAGRGLFMSTNGGRSFSEITGFHHYGLDRSIATIAVDPSNAHHLLVGTMLGRHGSSSVNGGRMTPPGAAPLGLFESKNSGRTWTQVINEPQDPVDGSSANGNDFFRGGVSRVEFDPNDPKTTYASVSDYGLYRREAGESSYSRIYSIASPGAAATSSLNRIEFDATKLKGGKTRIYLGDATYYNGSVAGFLRTDDAAAATPSWTTLSSPDKTSTGYDSYNFCQGQCSYDMVVTSPKGRPGTVVLSGSMNYDEIFTAHQPSNGRAIVRSTNAGRSFTDMTNDVNNNGLHPDQHALAFVPGHPDRWVLGDDGGAAVESGPFVDKSADCDTRGLTGQDLTNCRRWLSAIPTKNREVNSGLQTLQFQSISVHGGVLQGGTQDNGTWESDMAAGPAESVGGDGGNSYIDPAHKNIRMHTYYNPQIDVNFRGSDPTGWDWVADPLLGSGEASSFYVPMEGDRTAPGTVYTGLQHVWRTTDNGGRKAVLDQHCNEFTGDFSVTCGDWAKLGGDALNGPGDLSGTAYGSDNAGGGNYVVAITHAQQAHNVLWAATRRGRLFISTNANAADPSTVTFTRLDRTAEGGPLPTRFISGISLDPKDPYHAVVSYSGYSAYASGGHLYDVHFRPGSGTIRAKDISGDLGDQPITAVAYDWHTGAIYAGTDWGVLKQNAYRPHHARHWVTTPGLPPVAVYGLTLDPTGQRLFAATHGRGWYVDRIA